MYISRLHGVHVSPGQSPGLEIVSCDCTLRSLSSLFGDLFGNFWELFGIFWDIFGNLLVIFGIFWECLGHVWDISGIFVEHFWDLLGKFLGNF